MAGVERSPGPDDRPDADGDAADLRRRVSWSVVLMALVAIIGVAAFGVWTDLRTQRDLLADDPGDRPSSGVLALSAGECFTGDLDDGLDAGAGDAVACDEPHDFEVYAVVPVVTDDYPDAARLADEADFICGTAFADYVGAPPPEVDALGYATVYPTAAGWEAGQRDIRCVLFDPDDERDESARGMAVDG